MGLSNRVAKSTNIQSSGSEEGTITKNTHLYYTGAKVKVIRSFAKFESDQRKTSRAASSGEVVDSSEEDLRGLQLIKSSTPRSAHGASGRVLK